MNISHTKHMFSFLSTTSSKLGPPTYAILNTEAAYPKTIDRRARVLTSVTIHCVCFVLYLAYEKKKHKISRAEPVHVFRQNVKGTCATLKLCA